MDERARWQTLAWGVAAVVVVFLGARQLFGNRDSDASSAPPVAVRGASPSTGRGSGDTSSGRDDLYVHVAGAVRRPGLYRVRSGGRVAVAVRRAGGFTRRADPVAVNLAARLQDGQQVVVPARGSPAAASGAGGSGAAAAGAAAGRKISLATATEEQLDGLDGIGPALAKRIVEYRTQHGGFRSVEELQEVGGIGPKRFEALKDAVGP